MVVDTVAIVPTVVILFSTIVKVVLAVHPEGPVTITPTTELFDTVPATARNVLEAPL